MIQEKLFWILNEITKGQLLALQVGKNKDDGTLKHTQVSMIKRNNVNVARECAKLARGILGANGITSDYPVMRHMMNIESVYTYEGTDEMHTLILGHDITGIPALSIAEILSHTSVPPSSFTASQPIAINFPAFLIASSLEA